VDFELSADQQALHDAARALLDGVAPPAVVRAHLDSGGGFDSALWSAMVSQGWLGVAVPEPSGGLGLGWVELSVLLEETGSHVTATPFLQQVVALDVLSRTTPDAGDAAQEEAARWIPHLLDGGVIAAVPWREVQAEQSSDGSWTVSGRTEPAIFAPNATIALVQACEGVFLVDLSHAGGPPRREPAMDLSRALGWLTFTSTPAVRIGDAHAALRLLDAGAVAHSCELLGSAGRLLDLSVAYAKDRHQFGQPIGSFQAVKHRCADMLVDLEGMRSAARYAAWCLAANHPDRSVAACTAKAWCSDAGLRIAKSALQVHGGIGFTWESDVHFLLKRVQLDGVSFGDAAVHRTRLAGLLRDRVLAGAPVI